MRMRLGYESQESATLEMHETKTRFFPQMLVEFYCNFPLKKQASQKAGIIWHSTTRVLRRFLPQLTCLDQVWIAWNAERAWPAHFFRIWLLCGWRLETQIKRCEQGCFKTDQVLSQLPSSRCNLHTKASLYNGTSEFGDEFVPQIVEGFFSTKDKPREAWQQKVRRYNAGMRFGGLGFRRRHSIFFIKISSWQLVLSVWQRRSSNALSLWPVPVVSLWCPWFLWWQSCWNPLQRVHSRLVALIEVCWNPTSTEDWNNHG